MDENHTYILCITVYVTGCYHVSLVKQLFHLSVKGLTIRTSVMGSTGKCKTTKSDHFFCLMCSVFSRIAPFVHPNEGTA